jgi:hypothetical protein
MPLVSQDYGYWYKDFFLTPDMMTAYFAIDRQTMDNGCASTHQVQLPPAALQTLLCPPARDHVAVMPCACVRAAACRYQTA